MKEYIVPVFFNVPVLADNEEEAKYFAKWRIWTEQVDPDDYGEVTLADVENP